MMLLQLISIFAFTSTVFAGCTHLKIEFGRLECQRVDGTWGTVCTAGFDSRAATLACKQLGYDKNRYYESAQLGGDHSNLPTAVCYTSCTDDDDQFSQCDVQHTCAQPCPDLDYVIIGCSYNGYDNPTGGGSDDKPAPRHKSTGTVAGTTIGGFSIFGVIILVVICRIYMRYSYMRRRNNQTYVVTQQQQRRPRVLVARVIRTTTTVPSGPPPPPPYTPTQPASDYTPVPPRGYQPVATDDYTTTPSAPPSDVPSEPPPEYTPSASTNNAPPVIQDTVQ